MPAPELMTAELTLTGRITTASNATFLGSIADVDVVYKPIAGESPLWDFPHGCLAHREVAAYLVSQVFDWDIVPRTWLRDGPLGAGMVQLWQEQDPTQRAVNLLATEHVPETGWKHVLEGQDENGRMVSLVHEDSAALRRMAVFDAVVNNADRKGDHILAMTDGVRHGVDHGLTFHQDHKLRTVLWGWLGDALTDEELEGIDRVTEGLQGGLGRDLADLLSAEEIASLTTRCERLRAAGCFPAPSGEMPAVPWPLF
ncbi:SCO1664 family protein [Arthrobacter sp. StoSoilB22]|uniref:SCO1664 family protein n=1 Tax=Arthrobacter sp. StoSoilB22 TaxID=2830996 RepID=UPI001CC5F757|nr:SCO1664 family protein [Arthrobacter sp. StoSoilB22]BCW63022.1 phosphatidylinositol kinase [Arthrobacter sp. StoSoilB22]